MEENLYHDRLVIIKPRKCSECDDADSCQKFAVLGDYGSVCDAGEVSDKIT